MQDHPYREFERSGWERAARGYVSSFEKATALFASPVLDAAQVAHVTGVDFSASMLVEARRRMRPSMP